VVRTASVGRASTRVTPNGHNAIRLINQTGEFVLGNSFSRTLIAVMASVLVAACTQMGGQKPAPVAVHPAPLKDPWEAVKTELSPNGSGPGISVAPMDNGSLKANLPGDASFDKGSSAIKTVAQPALYQLAQSLNRHPTMRVLLVGYSDNSGDANFNLALSKNRARSVEEYLVAHGVDQSRLTVDGKGAADPVDDNASVAGRAHNRRVEIFLTMS
jgi:outer membrane protein OmpA-like peptidoglycan-associated protein